MPDGNRLRQLETADVPLPPTNPPPTTPAYEDAALKMILIGIKTLNQRTVVALGNLFTTFACLSVFWLYYCILPNPTVNQLVGLGLYAAFVLVLHIIRRKT